MTAVTAAGKEYGAVHRYEPKGACAQLFRCRDDEVLISGPAGTGKSRACLEKLHAMALQNPGMRALMVRKTAVSLADAALQTFRKFVIPEALTAGLVEWYGGSRQEPAQYRYSNGSAVMVGGMDNPIKVMSTEYDAIYVQELIELTVDDYEALTSRLRNGVVSFQQLLADTNPDAPFHWVKQRVDRGDMTMLESRHEDNPVLFAEDPATGRRTMTAIGKSYIGKLDRLTGTRHRRLRLGLWVASEGIIYEEYDPNIHVIDSFPIPDDWARWWAVDFGYVNPFVMQCWAEDGDGRLFMYREIYHSRRLVEDHCKQMMKIVAPGSRWTEDGDLIVGQWIEPKPRLVICDHDAEGRATLERYLGTGSYPADKNVAEGIQYVQQRLKVEGPNTPRLFFLKGATIERDPVMEDQGRPTATQDELLSYIWAKPPKTVEKPPKDEPEKENDHGADTMRYVVMERSYGAVQTRMV
jgi:phage terminase large subunit